MGLLARSLAEKRVLSYQSIWGADLLGARVNTAAGVPVTMENAVTLSAVFACVRLLADTVSTLPVGTFTRDRGATRPAYPRPPWLDTPSGRDPSITRIGYFSQVMMSLLLDGNSFTGLVYDDNAEVIETHVLDPRRVDIKRGPDSAPIYTVRLENGTQRTYDATDILHIPLIRMPGAMRGLSPVEAARQSIGLGKVAEQYGAEFFANGAAPRALILTEADLNKEQAEDLAEKFDARHSGTGKRHKTGVLTNGAKFETLSITPEQAQFLELRQYQTVDIARIYRIPPHLIQDVQAGSVSYASVEAQGIEYDTLTVRPYLEIIEVGHQRVLPRSWFLNFDEEGLLRGDLKGRFEAYGTGISAGFFLRSDARRKEDLTPVDGMDTPLVPLNLAAAETADRGQRSVTAARMVLAGFDPAESMDLAGLPPVKHLGIPPRTLQQAQLLDPTDPTSLYLDSGPQSADAGAPAAKIAATNGAHP